MSTSTRYGLAALMLGACIMSPIVAAQNANELRGKPSKDQILRALAPSGASTSAPRTRGLSLGSSSSESAAPAKAAAPQQKAVDLDIPFEFNSDRLTDDGREV